jgi:hypothetical protein
MNGKLANEWKRRISISNDYVALKGKMKPPSAFEGDTFQQWNDY